MTLAEYLMTKPRGNFKPGAFYSEAGEYVAYFCKDRPYFAKQIDSRVTVYLDSETKEMIGFKVDGVTRDG